MPAPPGLRCASTTSSDRMRSFVDPRGGGRRHLLTRHRSSAVNGSGKRRSHGDRARDRGGRRRRRPPVIEFRRGRRGSARPVFASVRGQDVLCRATPGPLPRRLGSFPIRPSPTLSPRQAATPSAPPDPGFRPGIRFASQIVGSLHYYLRSTPPRVRVLGPGHLPRATGRQEDRGVLDPGGFEGVLNGTGVDPIGEFLASADNSGG